MGATTPGGERRAPRPAPRKASKSTRDFVGLNAGSDTALEDHRRYPLCRVLLFCGLCGWARDYNPERIIARLRALRAGGYKTPVSHVARRVGWTCPGCGRCSWGSKLAYGKDVSPSEIQRAVRAIRS
jgi:hypothetical protein